MTRSADAKGAADGRWDDVRRADPRLAAAHEALVAAPRYRALSPVEHELIGLAAAAVCSGIDTAAIESHVRAALSHGATAAQLREVIELVSIQGIHTVTMGTPIVLEEAKSAGLPVPAADSPEALAVKEDFLRRRGYWSPLWEAVAAFDPDFLAAYLDFSTIPWEHGVLEPKLREFIYIVANSVTTHLFPDGLRIHVRNAFSHGATPAEVVEVLEIIATIGIRSALAAFPIIERETQPGTT